MEASKVLVSLAGLTIGLVSANVVAPMVAADYRRVKAEGARLAAYDKGVYEGLPPFWQYVADMVRDPRCNVNTWRHVEVAIQDYGTKPTLTRDQASWLANKSWHPTFYRGLLSKYVDHGDGSGGYAAEWRKAKGQYDEARGTLVAGK